MNEICINSQNIVLPNTKAELILRKPKSFSFFSTPSVSHNVIAECDSKTLEYIKKIFDAFNDKVISSKSSNRLAFLELYRKLVNKLEKYILVKKDIMKGEDVQAFSTLEVYPLSDYSDSNSDSYKINQREARVIDIPNEVSSDTLDNYRIEEVGYEVDPSQVAMEIKAEISLYEKLKKVNQSGNIFVDESRLLDKNLNVQNSISLDKIKKGSLNINDNNLNHVSISKTKILEMGKKRYNALKKVFKDFNLSVKEKVTSNIKFKKLLNYKISSINYSDSLIFNLPRYSFEDLKSVFRKSSSNFSNSTLYKQQLLNLKEKLTEIKNSEFGGDTGLHSKQI